MKDKIKSSVDIVSCSHNTIPFLETVAGEASFKSSTSNTMFILSAKKIEDESSKHNFLLSSNNEFIFSIHKVSTGPSNINHFNCCLGFSHNSVILTCNNPFFHSLASVKNPYNCFCSILFGFNIIESTLLYPFSTGKSETACFNVNITLLLVIPALPTIIRACLTFIVSYNCIHFFLKFSVGCNFKTLHFSMIIFSKRDKSNSKGSTEGNKS